jgi:tRNA G18 (ribose-2'-O)-methylase SpoU
MPQRLTVVAHNIRSLTNVGTLFRSCDAAGVSELILSGYTGRPPDSRIEKVALGSTEMVPWRGVDTIDELRIALKGCHVIVLEQHADSVMPSELSIPEGTDVALVCCEELFGADDDMLTIADQLLELPMRGQKHSLNVSVATSIAAFHIADALWGTKPGDLLSRQPPRPVREGVLTFGVTTGQAHGDPRTTNES